MKRLGPGSAAPGAARLEAEPDASVDQARVTEGTVWVKREPEWEAAQTELYSSHVVKDELVVGPELLQPSDAAELLPTPEQATPVADYSEQVLEERQQMECIVKLECKYDPELVSSENKCDPEPISGEEKYENFTSEEEHQLDSDTAGGAANNNDCDIDESFRSIKAKLLELVMMHVHVPSVDPAESSRGANDNARHLSPPAAPRACYVRLQRCDLEALRREIYENSSNGAGARSKQKQIDSELKRYICDICNKEFKQFYMLKRHVIIHTGIKPYSCKICRKAFRRIGTLEAHERIHSGAKPYSCEVCQKAFRQLNILKGHEKIHTGVKPYSCKICQKAFSELNTLRRHERIHAGAKPYSCKTCKKAFRQICTLKRHERIHIWAKP